MAGAAAFPVARHAHHALSELKAVDLRAVAAAGLLHVAMLVASALCWRRAFRACGGHIGAADACVRYGVGTFLNALMPARVGGAVRIGLFARSLSGEQAVQRSAAAVLGIGCVRAAALATVLAAAAVSGHAPPWLAAAPLLPMTVIAFTRRRVPSISLWFGTREAAVLIGWASLATICRGASIAAALVAVGIHSPVGAGVIGLIGLELSAVVPLAPGLAGVGAAGVAVALAAHGIPSATALAGGLAFYVAEGGAGILFGAAATAGFVLGGGIPARDRDVPVPVW